MENSAIIKLLKLATSLLELHDENPFKIRSYQTAVFNLEKTDAQLGTLSIGELEKMEGVGKSLAMKVDEMNRTESFSELNQLLEKTPEGVIEMFSIKGIGAKKIRTLWKDLGVETLDALKQACEENRVAKLKGFGEKTQETILQGLEFMQANSDKLHYESAEVIAQSIVDHLKKKFELASESGQVRRKLEVVDQIQAVVGTDQLSEAMDWLNTHESLQQNEKASSPFAWRGTFNQLPIPVEVLLVAPRKFASTLFANSAAKSHLAYAGNAGTLLRTATSDQYGSETDIYQRAGLPYIIPELREGLFEFDWAKTNVESDLITLGDLKGILHNHSTYSDGRNTLEEMAVYCKELGYEYLGISDHSKTATYANGLQEGRIRQQHEEIDALNQKLSPFKIFKGVESDILNDGALDYDEHVLASFDFIVASVHSNLKMDERKATQRLIKAIENPYTTMLGHPTGRLLLRREAYPIDHQAVIDACAANNVVIEINANPWRLDMDWRWVQYALAKGVMISINPDAHEKEGYHDMQYGVHVARKGGLTRQMTFNALPLAEIERHFREKRHLA